MRTKWNEAVMNRRDYLDTEVRKLMEKKEPSVSDLEKQNELLDQWAMLQWQRQAVLQPKPGSGVPGAPTNWYTCMYTGTSGHSCSHSHSIGIYPRVWNYAFQYCF